MCTKEMLSTVSRYVRMPELRLNICNHACLSKLQTVLCHLTHLHPPTMNSTLTQNVSQDYKAATTRWLWISSPGDFLIQTGNCLLDQKLSTKGSFLSYNELNGITTYLLGKAG